MVDAADITYTAPFAGAATRTLASKLAETVSVTDFGACQDSDPTATTAAFKAAILAIRDYANIRHHCLHVPAGRWLLNDTLSVSDNLSLVGVGKYASRLMFQGLNKPLVKYEEAHNASIRDLCIDNGSAIIPGAIGLDLTEAYMVDADHLIIKGVDIGVNIFGKSFGAYYNKLNDVTVSGYSRVGFLLDSIVAGSNVNENTLTNCQSHNAASPFMVLSGNNNRLYSPTAETSVAPTSFILVDSKAVDTLIVAPRAETNGAAGGIGVNIIAGATRTIVVGGNYHNVAKAIDNKGTDTTIVYAGTNVPPAANPPPASGAHRFWKVVKTNAAASGSYHSEIEVYAGAAKVNVTYPMFYRQQGLTGVLWSNLLDGNLTTSGFHTDSSPVGAEFCIDFGTGNEQLLTRWRWYVQGNVTATWNVMYSDDGTNWTLAASGLNCSGGAGWKEISWTN